MRRIAFYGKGGIGKSTVASNISLLYQQSGRQVLQIGCDPKHDSAHRHVPSDEVITAMDVFRDRTQDDPSDLFEAILMKGRTGVHCLEAGGPEPGIGCAGRATSLMLDIFDLNEHVLDDYDVVIYDVLGDVVCGGFATPIRMGHAEELYVVTSGEPMALYAANNIVQGFMNLVSDGGGRISGIVANMRGLTNEDDTIRRFAEAIHMPIVGKLPQDERNLHAEAMGGTVVEFFPESECVQEYKALLKAIENGQNTSADPTPMTRSEWNAFLKTTLPPSPKGS